MVIYRQEICSFTYLSEIIDVGLPLKDDVYKPTVHNSFANLLSPEYCAIDYRGKITSCQCVVLFFTMSAHTLAIHSTCDVSHTHSCADTCTVSSSAWK